MKSGAFAGVCVLEKAIKEIAFGQNSAIQERTTANPATMTTSSPFAGDEYHDRILKKQEEILKETDPALVANMLARHITLDPQTSRAIVSDMNQNFETPKDRTVVEELVSQMQVILLQQAQLELASVEAQDTSELIIFPFGFDRPTVSFPIQVLRYDWAAITCIQRFQRAGRSNEGGAPVFHSAVVTPDRTCIRYTRFAYNAVFGNGLHRTSLLAVYVAVFAAQGFDRQKMADDKVTNAVEHARLLMLGCLERVSQRLTDVHENAQLRKQTKSLTQLMRKQVQELVSCCRYTETFTSAKLVDLSAQFAKQRAAEHRGETIN